MTNQEQLVEEVKKTALDAKEDKIHYSELNINMEDIGSKALKYFDLKQKEMYLKPLRKFSSVSEIRCSYDWVEKLK